MTRPRRSLGACLQTAAGTRTSASATTMWSSSPTGSSGTAGATWPDGLKLSSTAGRPACRNISWSGTVYRLSGKPASPYPPYSIYPSADATIWATDWPGDIDIIIVARSIDRGASWNTWRPAERANVIAVAGVGEREAYLLIEPSPPPGAQPMEVKGPSQLLLTTDGGATWKDIGSDLPASPTNRPFTVGSDGSLLIGQPGDITPALTSSLLVSRDGGRHFTKAREYDRLDGAVGPPRVSPGSTGGTTCRRSARTTPRSRGTVPLGPDSIFLTKAPNDHALLE